MTAEDWETSKNESTFNWIIRNLTMIPALDSGNFISPKFKLVDLTNITWYLQLYATGLDNSVSLYLVNNDSRPFNCAISCKTKLNNFNGDLLQDESLNEISGNQFKYQLETFIYDEEFEECTPYDILHVECVFVTVHDEKDLKDKKILSREIGTLCNGNLFTDTVLHTADKDFAIHRCILGARWSALAQKLETTSKGQSLDVSSSVMRTMIKYMYTGKIDCNSSELLTKVLEAAVRYNMTVNIKSWDMNMYSAVSRSKNVTRINAQKIKLKCFLPGSLPTSMYTNIFSVSLPHQCIWNLALRLCKGEVNTYLQISLWKIFDAVLKPILVKIKLVSDEIDVTDMLFSHLFTKNSVCTYDVPLIGGTHGLSLQCEFTFGNTDVKNCTTHKSCMLWSPMHGLCENYLSDLRSLLESGLFSDLEIKVGSEIFPVHRAILCARSRAFMKLLSNEKLEMEDKTIVISTLEPAIVQAMLEYMYCAELHSLNVQESSNVLKLYVAAYKYGISGLRAKCRTVLQQNLSIQNASKFLDFAKTHKDEVLYQSVKNWFFANSDEILGSNEWMNFSQQNKHSALQLLLSIDDMLG